MGVLRVLALIGGVIFLLPGLCFLAVGASVSSAGAAVGIGLLLLLIAVGLFWLGFLGFRREPKTQDSAGDDEGPTSEG
jgi:membrane protein implicated in regulation of membrane protease activity